MMKQQELYKSATGIDGVQKYGLGRASIVQAIFDIDVRQHHSALVVAVAAL